MTTKSIPEWFANKNVLITGSTGFMGKVLVSKLLLSCPDIGEIFLIIRKKKGYDPQIRLQLLLQQEPFRILREQYPERLKKLIVIFGDITVEELALSVADKERLTSRVAVVFHMAASVRFDLPLKNAIKMNTISTINVIALAKQLPLLESFIHISTSFCQCGEAVLEERAYHSRISPDDVIHMVNTMTDDALEAMRLKLLGEQPNTYAYSKALSEEFVSRCGLPVGVIRPSIVTASFKEPVPGWVDNMNGPTGLMIGAGKGVVRSMLCNADYVSDIIPCDMAVNATIALAWQVGMEKSTKPLFLNATANHENPISWGDALEIGKKHVLANPFSQPLWYPGGRLTSSKVLHWLAVMFFQTIPAYLLDILLIVTGNKPFLVRVQNRVNVGLELLQYYTMKQWVFRDDNLRDLEHQLCPSDKETFFTNTKLIGWNEYLLAYILGKSSKGSFFSAARMEQSKTDDVAPDRIAETLAGQKILVTGGTGFLGKVLIEKLLRCLPDIAHIYMLIRTKKGKDPKHRLDEIFSSPLFEKVKTQRGLSALEKTVTAISGDVSMLGLGLSPEDRKMLIENVTIVIHGAATVRFDELLKRAVLLNTRGTKQMVELAKEMKHLILFVHISTAYCHLEEKVLGERTYPPPADPHQVIKCVEWMDDDVVEAMTDKILGKLPNTYAFTKALSESIVEESMQHIPSIILRTMYCNENGYADYLPVDIAVNGILLTTWNFIYFKDHEKRVYNMTSSNEFKVTWAEIITRGRKITEKIPLNGVVWYPGGSLKKSRFIHNICILLFHMIPAYIIDALLFLAGYKPIMCHVQRRINKGFEVFEYYANNQWDFENTYVEDIRAKLNSTEYKNYQVHGEDLDIDAYFEDCIRAARIYILKELPETLPAARRHLRVMYWVDVITKILFFLLIIYLLASWSESFRTLLTTGVTYVTKLINNL
ncbi:Fatty acyl-CoA reductase [Temnothorax longispinosus]|uniref:Fatty acyl-CoA reductase n=1 Tax=Temnothorax longispinosus TaxID=300112 RepID=A0A4S2LAW6_9HYME|nr:Fatty acyl-CoA reductase [Temnothorax longispinosus]